MSCIEERQMIGSRSYADFRNFTNFFSLLAPCFSSHLPIKIRITAKLKVYVYCRCIPIYFIEKFINEKTKYFSPQ